MGVDYFESFENPILCRNVNHACGMTYDSNSTTTYVLARISRTDQQLGRCCLFVCDPPNQANKGMMTLPTKGWGRSPTGPPPMKIFIPTASFITAVSGLVSPVLARIGRMFTRLIIHHYFRCTRTRVLSDEERDEVDVYWRNSWRVSWRGLGKVIGAIHGRSVPVDVFKHIYPCDLKIEIEIVQQQPEHKTNKYKLRANHNSRFPHSHDREGS